jgi:acyl-CoA thioester hydrolase
MIKELVYFRHKFKVEVRFSDLDAIGHVNNSRYLTYAEEARIDYFRTVFGLDTQNLNFGTVVARNEIDYIKPILLGDHITIYTRCTHIGNKSTTYESLFIRSCPGKMQMDEVVAKNTAVQVEFNYKTQESTSNAAEKVEKILEFESPTLLVDNWSQVITN